MRKPVRGELQTESLVVRLTASDKENIKNEANRRGITYSDIVKEALIKCNIIRPVYYPF